MEKGRNLKRESRPTMQQLQYLMELEKIGGGRGNVMMVAEACGVSHGPVSRYLKACFEKGYLDQNNEFTELGRAWLGGYKSLIGDLEDYLRQLEGSQEDVKENTKRLIENVDYYLLVQMTLNERSMRRTHGIKKKDAVSRKFLSGVLKKGIWETYFIVYCLNREQGTRLSMADRGFKKPAFVRNNKRGSWLELCVADMTANSRIDGQMMTGHVESLKYVHNERLTQAEIKVNTIRIPLEACRFQVEESGRIKGSLSITMTCSVGRIHMPENTALLVFWM